MMMSSRPSCHGDDDEDDFLVLLLMMILKSMSMLLELAMIMVFDGTGSVFGEVLSRMPR